MIYSALFFAAVAPIACVNAVPTFNDPAAGGFLDKREDSSSALGGKILASDLLAGLAAPKQQVYQSTQKPNQWKKCNPSNIVVRREWYVSVANTEVSRF